MEPRQKQRITSEFAEVDGTRLHVRRVGEIAGKGDAPLVLLHGLGGDSTSWTLNHRALAAGRPVVAVDLPGHGQSDRTVGDGTVPATGALLSSLPDALGIDRFHLVGLSYGGALAMDIAGRLPDRILSLTCVSATGLGHEVNIDFILGYLEAETPAAMRPWLELLYHNARKVNDAMIAYALFGRADPDYRACVRQITDANFENGGQRFNYRDALEGFPFPVHMIWGREDRIVPVAHTQDLPPGVRVEILDNAGHMPNAERAEAFNALMLDLIAAVETSG
jgi:pyruvate dehydrogenase E2 component (dihydrolipoyllysine-residue acetyltransferase)